MDWIQLAHIGSSDALLWTW